jgi:hypothetical protein
MLPRRASPQAKWGATNVTVFMFMTTKAAVLMKVGGPFAGNLSRPARPLQKQVLENFPAVR